eukprot:TRINITY_DN16687_c0_g1_i1.p1 TRINITY_DN16687_c0_g1~~TRINITY_DN16687_c0_g1_i1.p1  ORF type:complete len:497 (+),score=120.58 TRINITY_DN16687_c0_g1_i1:239-1729(+)
MPKYGNRRQLGHSKAQAFVRTKLCKFDKAGICTRGAECSFAHGSLELQTVPDFSFTRLCRDFLKAGACKAGADCKFAHGLEELRPCPVVEMKEGEIECDAMQAAAGGASLLEAFAAGQLGQLNSLTPEQLVGVHASLLGSVNASRARAGDPAVTTDGALSSYKQQLEQLISWQEQLQAAKQQLQQRLEMQGPQPQPSPLLPQRVQLNQQPQTVSTPALQQVLLMGTPALAVPVLQPTSDGYVPTQDIPSPAGSNATKSSSSKSSLQPARICTMKMAEDQSAGILRGFGRHPSLNGVSLNPLPEVAPLDFEDRLPFEDIKFSRQSTESDELTLEAFSRQNTYDKQQEYYADSPFAVDLNHTEEQRPEAPQRADDACQDQESLFSMDPTTASEKADTFKRSCLVVGGEESDGSDPSYEARNTTPSSSNNAGADQASLLGISNPSSVPVKAVKAKEQEIQNILRMLAVKESELKQLKASGGSTTGSSSPSDAQAAFQRI